MKRLLKIVGWMLGGVVGIVVLLLATAYTTSSIAFNKHYDIPGRDIPVPTDSASIAEGKRMVSFRACTDCHGPNLAGRIFMDPGPIVGRATAPNITGGQGSRTGSFTTRDWDRAIRHGVSPEGRCYIIMPAKDYFRTSDTDLGKMIAYLKNVPKVDSPDLNAEVTIGPLMRTLYMFGQVPDLVPAEVVDHSYIPTEPRRGITLEHGQYMAQTCTGCHQSTFKGGPLPGMPPDFPPAADITPAGRIKSYSDATFLQMLRTGKTPEGRKLDPKYMPWPAFANMTDDEIRSLYLFLAKQS